MRQTDPSRQVRSTRVGKAILLLAVGLAVWLCPSCQGESTPRLYGAVVDPSGWHRGAPASIDLLVERGQQRHTITLVLRHDHRVATTQLPLEVVVLSRGLPIYSDTLELRLADRPGHWLRPRVAVQEVDSVLSRPISIPHAGLYQVQIAPLVDNPVEGILSLAIGLSQGH